MTMLEFDPAMVEWPQQRRHRLNNRVVVPQQRLEDIPPELLREVEGTRSFAVLANALHDAFNRKANPQMTIAELSETIGQPDAFGDYDDIVRQVIPALVSISALSKTPTSEMWEYLWSLAGHSAALQTFLPQAIIAAAADARFRHQFLEIAYSVVTSAAKNPGRRALQREKKVGATLRDHWQTHRYLSALWRGHFEHSFDAVDLDDANVLSIVVQLDVIEFVRLLALYDYPDPVAHALFWCGTQSRFDRWRAAALAAPVAFGERGEWNGSLILPLLLSIARDQFQFGLGRNSTSEQVADATREIRSLAAEVAKTIAQRRDALECMTRWGNWLIFSEIPAISANPVPYPMNAASEGFVDDTLLEALIRELPSDRWSPEPAPDTENWELWCHFASGALIALAGKTSMPSAAALLCEWHLTPDTWPGKHGEMLRLHASPFQGVQPRADGYGARILALLIVEGEPADDRWEKFWGTTTALREVVEFGDSEETDTGGWQRRMDAAELLMLQFSIGLMMMDHVIEPPRPLGYDRRSALQGLVTLLDEAVREMVAIDQFHEKFWSEADRHLAIRRAKWLTGPTASDGVAFSADAKPTLADFIRDLAGDTENLLILAYTAEQNGVDRAALASAFKAAEVDLRSEIGIAERLLAISPRSIGLNELHLESARKIADERS